MQRPQWLELGDADIAISISGKVLEINSGILSTVPINVSLKRPRKRAAEPLTPILPDAHDRIFTVGYSYYPVHTEIYGTYRPRSTR